MWYLAHLAPLTSVCEQPIRQQFTSGRKDKGPTQINMGRQDRQIYSPLHNTSPKQTVDVISTLDMNAITVNIQNHRNNCLVDTGATISCCSVTLLKHLHINDIYIEKSNIHDCVGVGVNYILLLVLSNFLSLLAILFFCRNFMFFKVKPAFDFSFGLCAEEQGQY